MAENKVIPEGVLADIVRRIVEVAHPERIILFGSAARGALTSNSDIDLLVVTRGQAHRGHLTEAIYMNLIGVGQAVDIIVATPEDVERYRDSLPLSLPRAALGGKVIYAS